MTLISPIWLLLLAPVGAILWWWRMPTRLLLVLRAATFGLIVAALSGPSVRMIAPGGTVVVVADRSLSMPPDSDQRHAEVIHLIQGAMGPDDRLAVVGFAADAVVERSPQTGRFDGFKHAISVSS